MNSLPTNNLYHVKFSMFITEQFSKKITLKLSKVWLSSFVALSHLSRALCFNIPANAHSLHYIRFLFVFVSSLNLRSSVSMVAT